eukprot:6433288-Amphidinium_carterae.1
MEALEKAITAASNGERGKQADIDASVLFPTLHWLWQQKAPEDSTEDWDSSTASFLGSHLQVWG